MAEETPTELHDAWSLRRGEQLRVDVREVPLTAPTGTPPPLRDAFEAVAAALFQAAEVRGCPPTARPMFEEQARELSAAYRRAEERYASAEIPLRAVVNEAGRCAHHEALAAIRQVNDAVGHVMLPRGGIPFDQAAAHIRTVPEFDSGRLLLAMRDQTARAVVRSQAIDGRGNSADQGESATGLPPWVTVHFRNKQFRLLRILWG